MFNIRFDSEDCQLAPMFYSTTYVFNSYSKEQIITVPEP
jgi:hypothetical protein